MFSRDHAAQAVQAWSSGASCAKLRHSDHDGAQRTWSAATTSAMGATPALLCRPRSPTPATLQPEHRNVAASAIGSSRLAPGRRWCRWGVEQAQLAALGVYDIKPPARRHRRPLPRQKRADRGNVLPRQIDADAPELRPLLEGEELGRGDGPGNSQTT